MKWDFYQCNCKLLTRTTTVVAYICFIQVNYYWILHASQVNNTSMDCRLKLTVIKLIQSKNVILEYLHLLIKIKSYHKCLWSTKYESNVSKPKMNGSVAK